MRENFPARRAFARHAPRIDCADDALRAVTRTCIGHQLRVLHGGGVDADLVGAGIQQPPHIGHRAHAAADGERDEHLCRHRFDDRQNQVALVTAGGDVKKGEFVGALLVVTRRHFDRITGVAQTDEVDALDHAAGFNVETGDDAFGQHAGLRIDD